MKKLIQRIKCLFGFHGKGRWQIEIYDIRFASHAIEYGQHYRCEYCEREIDEPLPSISTQSKRDPLKRFDIDY